jgi:hypothetical protein
VNPDTDDELLLRLPLHPTDTAPAADPPICGPGSVPEHSC